MKKKWTACLLACLMLLGTALFAPTVQAAGSSTDPEVTLLVSNIEDKYVEVALLLNGGGAGRDFLNAGISVEYNTRRLTPVDWAGNEFATLGSGWSNATRLDTKGSDAVSGKTALLYEKGSLGHLYLSAEAIQTLSVPAGQTVQAVTVRFKYDTAPTAGNFGDVAYESDSDIAKASPALGVALYSAGTANSGVVIDPANPGGYFRYEQNGVTAGGGTGSASDFHTVVFYDWDNTLLGSRIVADGGSLTGDHNSPAGRGDGANQAPMPPEYDLVWDVNGNGSYDFIGNNNAGNDAANKKGYTFAGWVDYTTGYSVPNVDIDTSGVQAIPSGDLVSLTGITKNLIVKAAYSEDSTFIGTTPINRRYLVSYTPFKAVDGVLQTEITVRRPQNARRTVEGETYLRIQLQPADRGQAEVIIPLGASDAETVTFSMPIDAAASYDKTAALSLTVSDAKNVVRSAAVQITANEIIGH